MEPHHHQITNLITFCRRLPVTLLAGDVGLGKTIRAGLIMSEFISRSRLSKIRKPSPCGISILLSRFEKGGTVYV